MTIVVSVRVTDGIVLAADSATTFFDQAGQAVKVYNNANKIFNLVKGLPIGAMVYGSGSIGGASIETLSKDFRARLAAAADPPLLRDAYTIEDVAALARQFLEDAFRQAYSNGIPGFFMGYRLCGYSAGATFPEAWEVRVLENGCEGPTPSYSGDDALVFAGLVRPRPWIA